MTSMRSASRTVLVTDGEQRSALAAVRSLGRAGFRVEVCASRPGSLAGASRHCRREHLVADPLHDPEVFRAQLAAISWSADASVVIPVSEAALLAVLPHRDELHGVLPFPSAAAFGQICDKALVLEAAARHGIRVPAQVVLHSAPDGPLAPGTVSFPVVIKPSRSVVGIGADRAKTSVLYAEDEAALSAALRTLPPAAFPVLLQERVHGPGFAISVLLWDGELRAAFAHRRLREKPPSGGVSVLREGIELSPELLARSVALLSEFEWQGVAMVEFKLHERTGVPYLMEINGRLWGSLQLAIDSGVDFPELLVAAALGERRPAVAGYRPGTRTRWEWGDVDHLLAVLRHSRERLALPLDAPGRLRTLANFLATFTGGARSEVLRLRDPWPFVRETLDWVRGR
jgi:predicted ATP-grasp superfamily ATP-dependent carboligase